MSHQKTTYKLIITLQLWITISFQLWSQCGSTISSFPYYENFETTAAWTAGGTNSDWAWGTPAHPILNTAGGGVKSWCVGGLTGSFYSYSQDSWIKSPCFDFSNLAYPWISFKIFWEDEWKYDGLTLEYSTNNGSSWSNVGAYGDPADCMNDNWFNYNNITYVTSNPKHGWAGRTQATSGSCQGGHGSMGWVVAKHCLSNLAHQPSVKFRFHFGAGTNCNNFDGIAIDDVTIDNAPPNLASFSYVCSGGTTINFTNTSAPCPTGYSWNFGDPSSGAANTSTIQNPTHIFSSAGTFNVKLISLGPCNAPDTIITPISILAVTTSVTNASCSSASNGSITANATGGNGAYTYSWQPGGQTSQTVTGLSVGSYTVTVTSGCTASATASIASSSSNSLSTTITAISPITCYNNSDGSLQTTINGGIPPYSIHWSSGDTITTISNLSAGNYCIIATDSAGCTDSSCFTLANPSQVIINATNDTVCNGQDAIVSATASGGTSPYTYSWNNGAYIGQNYTSTTSNNSFYTVIASDSNACVSAIDTAFITILPPLLVLLPDSTFVCSGTNTTIAAFATGGNGNYNYTWSPSNQTGMSININPTTPTVYTVTVADGCTTPISQDSTIISISPSPTSDFNATVLTGCAPLCTNFSDNSIFPNGTITAWHWQFGDGGNTTIQNPNHCYTTAGSFPVSLTVTASNGCKDSTISNNFITAFPSPIANFYPSTSVTSIYEPTIDFTDASTIASGNITTWQWNFGDSTFSNSASTTHTYNTISNYNVQLIVTSNNGCKDSTYQNIEINNGFTFYAPNAITANHDSLNDVFIPKGTGWDTTKYELFVFDRWGNLVFSTTDITKGWDGKTSKNNNLVMFDVFVWKVNLFDTSKNEHHFYGIVSVLQ